MILTVEAGIVSDFFDQIIQLNNCEPIIACETTYGVRAPLTPIHYGLYGCDNIAKRIGLVGEFPLRILYLAHCRLSLFVKGVDKRSAFSC